jgi:hypothetical protein
VFIEPNRPILWADRNGDLTLDLVDFGLHLVTTREGAIIERVRTGAPARWASNHENPLALLECGG